MPPRTKYLVGVDLGGTNIVAGALAEDGSDLLALRSEATRADQGADAVVDRIARMIDTVIAETIAQTGARRDDVIGVGVGAPGPLDRERGIVVTTPNLGWTNFPLRDVIAERTRLFAAGTSIGIASGAARRRPLMNRRACGHRSDPTFASGTRCHDSGSAASNALRAYVMPPHSSTGSRRGSRP